MPKRKRTTKKLHTVENARQVFLEATETVELTVVQQVMRDMGRKGGQIGGKRRLETTTDEQRRRSAGKAAKTRWSKAKKAQ
ncbi:MAG: RNA-binding protein [Planctomycetota bacterium]